MSNERKILYMSAGVNFTVGIVIGIILFYGQLHSGKSLPQELYAYDRDVVAMDLVRVLWIDLIWIISVIIARSMLHVKLMHPVLIARGCVNAFTVLYILNYFGIKEAIVSILPQCLTILPLLLVFSSETAIKSDTDSSKYLLSVKRRDVLLALFFSFVAAGTEVIMFAAFCTYLF